MKIKAVSGITLTLLFIGMLILAFNIQLVKAEPTTIIVPDDYEKIQWAVGNATEGDTVFVRAGTYYEHVVVNKTVTLIGEGKYNTIIDGNLTGNVIEIMANNVTVSGFTLRNGGTAWAKCGIYIDHLSGNNISHNVITNNCFGIWIRYSSGNTISGNTVSLNNDYGILIYESSNNTVTGNTISSNDEYGIQIRYSDNNTLTGNTVSNNGYGIYLHVSGGNVLSGNTASNNSYNFDVFGHAFSVLDNHVDKSNMVDGKPIYYLKGVTDTIYDARTNAGTFYLINCINITIKDLTLTKNGHGLFLWNTTNSKIENVTASKNKYGIYLGQSGNNLLIDNTASNNGYGIYLIQSGNNTITGNMVSNNQDGVYLSVSGDNALFHNNFIRNTNQEYVTSGHTNIWDDGYPSGGNYWSDYEDRYPDAEELDDSGIWDTPYVIDEDNQDNYPLMPPDTTSPTLSILSPENKTYTVNEVPLTFTVSEPTSWIGYSLDGQANITIAGNTTLTGLSDGMHSLIVYASDIAGNVGYSDIVYFTIQTTPIDTTPPSISILSPENKTYDTTDIPLTFTIDESVSWIAYSLDGQANLTITGNTTLSGLSDDSHSLMVYAKDTAGNTGASEIIYFTIETEKEEAFPTLILATIVIAGIAVLGVAVYFLKKRKPPTPTAPTSPAEGTA